jgi:hypothetical protein
LVLHHVLAYLIIQSENKYIMLQRSAVDRWLQSDYILLIHPCPEKFPIGYKDTEISERIHKFYGMLSLFYIKKVAQNGGRLHVLHRLAIFERFPAFPGLFQLLLQSLPQDHVVSPLESRTPGFACTPREMKPVESSQESEGARLLDPYIQSICCQKFHRNTHGRY